MTHDRKLNVDGFTREWWEPAAWPRWARFAFILTLPISVPLYAMIVLAVMIVIAMGIAACTLFSVAPTNRREMAQFLANDESAK